MIRAVVDTPVLVAGLIGPEYSPAAELLAAHRAGEFERITSPRLFAELEGVLRGASFSRLAERGIAGGFVDELAAASLFAADPYDLPRVTADRHHDLLVAVARAGGARFVVTSEDELLRSFVRGVSIVTPAEFVAALARVDALRAG